MKISKEIRMAGILSVFSCLLFSCGGQRNSSSSSSTIASSGEVSSSSPTHSSETPFSSSSSSRILKKYTCNFYNYNRDLLWTSEVNEGTDIDYHGATPKREKTAESTFVFSGWDKSLKTIEANTDFTAQFKNVINQYQVTFNNEDGTAIKTDYVPYGSYASFDQEKPVKARDQHYTYNFSGWSPSLSETPIVEDTVFTAQYGKSANKYQASFYASEEDATPLYTTNVAYGEFANYSGDTPTKDATAASTYAFAGWDANPAETPIVKDTRFNATFTGTLRQYEAAFYCSSSASEALYTTKVEYGKFASYGGETPTKDGNAQYSYVFAGWDKDPSATKILGYTRFNAVFTQTTNSYTASFYDSTNATTPIWTTQVAYGSTCAFGGTLPSKEDVNGVSYPFVGWDSDPEKTPIKGNTSFYAKFGECGAYRYNLNKDKNQLAFGDNETTTNIRAEDYSSSNSETNALVVAKKLTSYEGGFGILKQGGYIYSAEAIKGLYAITISTGNLQGFSLAWGWANNFYTERTTFTPHMDAGETYTYRFKDAKRPSYFRLASTNGDLAIKSIILTYTRVSSEADVVDYFRFTLNETGDAYILTSVSASVDECIIPSSYLGKPVVEIGENAFDRPSGVWSSGNIGNYVQIPSSITKIDKNAFSGNGFAAIDLPNSITSIGDYAFSGCGNLLTFHLPASVVSLGANITKDCSSLMSFSVESGSAFSVSSDQRCLIDSNGVLKAFAYRGMVDYTLPSGVTMIGPSAFAGCYKLKSIAFPAGTTSIADYAFDGCEGLVNLSIPKSVTSIGNFAFNNCKGLQSVVFESGSLCSKLGDSAFENDKVLASVNLPSGVTDIGREAFACDSSLSAISLAGAVNINDEAFELCTGLTQVSLPACLKTLGGSAFSECSALKEVTFGSPTNLEKINNGTFEKDALTAIALPDGLGVIEDGAFKDCESLSSVTLPTKRIEFTKNAFYECTSLHYNVLNSVDYLGNGVTSYYAALGLHDSNATSVILSDDCSYVGKEAFSSCNSIDTFKAGSHLDYIGFHAFYYCSKLLNIDLGSITSIDEGAFSHINANAAIVLPTSIKTIGVNAFVDSGLAYVYYAGDVSDWAYVGKKNIGVSVAYYLESQPKDTSHKYWYYNGATPTIWKVV
jgi:hypothetical protein